MLISWKWLQEYVQPGVDVTEAVRRWTMSGLNHEETVPCGDDLTIDLEVTSNRPDCLGHLGVARELATLLAVPLRIPDPKPVVASTMPVERELAVRVEAADLCPLYTARVIRGVRIGPSPAWMQQRLQAAGIAAVNNVVDCTNYVMLECGQPLHAFDLARLRGRSLVIRRPAGPEKITAIDHREYQLDGELCLIADAEGPVAVAGVMGGAESEVSPDTTDLVIEAAVFSQAAVRFAARRLNLHSPSSHRFERAVSPHGVDWASLRCCELILQTAGGQLCSGVLAAGAVGPLAEPIQLRLSRIEAVLGIAIPGERVAAILERLGLQRVDHGQPAAAASGFLFQPPWWRPDLTREIDLIEEVGRITGYEQVPDDVVVPMVASTRPARARVLGIVRSVLTGAGLDEAMTPSLVPAAWSGTVADAGPAAGTAGVLIASQPMLGVLEKASQNIGSVDRARRSLLPSLLEARRINEYRGNLDAELFETAAVYCPGSDPLPAEPLRLGMVSSRGFGFLRGLVEELVRQVCPGHKLKVTDLDSPWLDPTMAGSLWLGGEALGSIGETSTATTRSFGLRGPVAVAELELDLLIRHAVLVRRQARVSSYPAITRDFNFLLDDPVRWEQLEQTIRGAAGELAESVTYRETFRDPQRDGAGKKRVLLQVVLRSQSETLTGEQAEQIGAAVVLACGKSLGARLA